MNLKYLGIGVAGGIIGIAVGAWLLMRSESADVNEPDVRAGRDRTLLMKFEQADRL